MPIILFSGSVFSFVCRCICRCFSWCGAWHQSLPTVPSSSTTVSSSRLSWNIRRRWMRPWITLGRWLPLPSAKVKLSIMSYIPWKPTGSVGMYSILTVHGLATEFAHFLKQKTACREQDHHGPYWKWLHVENRTIMGLIGNGACAQCHNFKKQFF